MEAVVSGLQAALLLARGRSDGLRFLENTPATALRSFWALLLTLPAAVCLPLIDWAETGAPPHLGQALGLNLAAFAIGWLGFAVLSFELAPMLGGREHWPRFIAAWNWCNLIENVLLVLGCLPGLLGAPTILGEAAQLFAIGWALWIEWFAIRHALQTNGLIAVWLVVLDQTIGLLLAAVTFKMMHG